jgi:hypothetical protein
METSSAELVVDRVSVPFKSYPVTGLAIQRSTPFLHANAPRYSGLFCFFDLGEGPDVGRIQVERRSAVPDGWIQEHGSQYLVRIEQKFNAGFRNGSVIGVRKILM